MKKLYLLLACLAWLCAGAEAEDELDSVQPVSASAEGLYAQGSDALEAGKVAQAVSDFEQALRISPLYYDALYSLAGAYRRQGRFEESILLFQRLLRYDPQLVDAWYQLGLAYAGEGDYAKAVDAYRLTLERSPGYGQCHCALSLALRETQHSRESLAEAQNCLAQLPNYAGAWNLIGNAQTDLGDFQGRLGLPIKRPWSLKPSLCERPF